MYRLSRRAVTELDAIAIYTVQRWGEAQAGKYLGEMEAMFELLAETPGLGRAVLGWPMGTRRIEQGSHIIFYRPSPEGVFIQRVLHKNMLPRR